MTLPLLILRLLLLYIMPFPESGCNYAKIDQPVEEVEKNEEETPIDLGNPIWERGGIMTGFFSHYDQGPTDATLQFDIDNGRLSQDQPAGTIYLAHGDCSRVGSQLWVRILDGPWSPAVVFDCGGHWEGLKWMADNDILGELDFYTVQSIGRLHQGAIAGQMSYEDPR